MYTKTVRLMVAIVMALMPARMLAQGELLEYRWDIGGGLAMVMPITDGVGFMQSVDAGAGLVARRVFNPRMALRTNLSWLHAHGDTHSTFIPANAGSMTAEGGEFASRQWSRSLIEIGMVGELNFWGYGLGPTYKGNKRVTPYILLGAGMMAAMGGEKTNMALIIPVGAGVKYKLGKRLNLGVEWRFSFTTTDSMDNDGSAGPNLSDPYGISSTGLKNKDQYSTLMVSLTYDISPKYRKCNN